MTDIFEESSDDLKNLNIREDVIGSFERSLLKFWKKYLFSNIRAIELSDISIIFNQTASIDAAKPNNASEKIEDEKPTLAINYLIKLDPRISQNGKIIYKLIDIINATLFNSEYNFYRNAIDSNKFFQNFSVVTLTLSQISCKFIACSNYKS